MFARSLVRPFAAAGAAALLLCGSVAGLGQETSGFLRSAFQAAFSRFAPEPETPPGLVRVPERSFEQKLGAYAGALTEDAVYRATADLDAALNGFEPQRVLDGDWEVVANTKQIPYRAVCQIDCEWSDLDVYGDPRRTSGTAVFVSPRVLLTSARNFYRSTLGGYVATVTVYPGRSGASRPYGSALFQTGFLQNAWLSSEKPEHELAWIILPDATLYDRIDYAFDYRAPNDVQLGKWDLNSLGYPRPYVDGIKQYHDFETADQIVSPTRFRHFHDSVGECHGGPIYYQRRPGEPRQIVGIQSVFPANAVTNWAARMTETWATQTDSFVTTYP